MSKKKVTAPLTYNPGKGRPKEHLAYLNWQEMEALKRLNGNNQERGPMGLPSFPPADARGSSSKASSSKSSSSSTGARGPTGPKGEARTSPAGGKSVSGGAGTGKGGDSKGGIGSQKASTNRGPGASMAAAKASSKASAAAPEAKTRSVARGEGAAAGLAKSSAQKAYTPSRAALEAVRRGPGAVSGMAPGNKDKLAQERSLYSITAAVNEKLGRNYSPKQVSEMARAVAGEAAGEDEFGRSAVANTMLNRIALASQDPKKYGYMGGNDFGKLMGQYDATGRRKGTKENAVFKSAKPGTANYQAGLAALADAANPTGEFARTASPTVKNATHYYNPDASDPKWGQRRSGKQFEAVGRHLFGNAEPTEEAVSLARANIDGFTVTPLAGEPEALPSGGIMNLVPDSMKVGYMKGQAKKLGEALPGMVSSGMQKVKNYLTGAEEEAPVETALTKEQQENVDAVTKRGTIGLRGAGLALGALGVPAAGLLAGKLGGGYKANVQERLEEYAKATPEQKLALEKKDPALIGWGKIANIPSESPYSDYQSWAQDRGLRAPNEGGRDSGIMAIKTPTTAPTPTASTVGTSTPMAGNRPESHYYWDLGVNIPAMTDPNYTQYQEYLRQRAAAQAAMYGTV